MLTDDEQEEVMRLAKSLATVKARAATEVARQITNPPQARQRVQVAEQKLGDFLRQAAQRSYEAHCAALSPVLEALRRECKCYSLQAPDHLTGAIDTLNKVFSLKPQEPHAQ